jgi:hypothetical protein
MALRKVSQARKSQRRRGRPNPEQKTKKNAPIQTLRRRDPAMGRLDRTWNEQLQAFVCPGHVNSQDVNAVLEKRPTRDKCGGCGYIPPNMHSHPHWDAKTHRWVCRGCRQGRPTKPAVCETSWCSRAAQVWRDDNKTWVCTSCKYPSLSAINETRSLRVKCEDCGKKNTVSRKLFWMEACFQPATTRTPSTTSMGLYLLNTYYDG